MKRLLLSAAVVLASFTNYAQQPLKLPSLSPNAKISQDFSVSNIEISYSRPSMRNRKVFGDVVQLGKPWRTGANAPTKIKFGEDVIIAETKIKAGEYALYTVPNKESWEIVLNTGAGAWSAEGFSRENDIVRFHVKPTHMETPCQTFTIEISDLTYNTCKIEMMWDKTLITIPVTAQNDEKIETNIDAVLNHPTLPYFQVANYYFESGKKLDKAETYVDLALAENPKGYFMWYLKARIERKLGNYQKAVEAARKAMETAQGSAFEADYLHNCQKMIDEIKKGGQLSTDKKSY